jgi:hypothetical protein
MGMGKSRRQKTLCACCHPAMASSNIRRRRLMVWPLLALGVVEMVQKTAEKPVLKSQGRPTLATRLKLVLLPEPHGHWEGRLKGGGDFHFWRVD